MTTIVEIDVVETETNGQSVMNSMGNIIDGINEVYLPIDNNEREVNFEAVSDDLAQRWIDHEVATNELLTETEEAWAIANTTEEEAVSNDE